MSAFSVLAAAREAPGRAAIVTAQGELAFAELAARVHARLPALAQIVEPAKGGFVAVLADNSLASIELILALVELHVPFLPLHPRLTDAERSEIFARLRPSAWVRAAGDHTELELLAGATRLDTGRAGILEAGEAPLALLLTSGSSGTPRAAVLSERALRAAAQASAQNIGWREAERWFLCLPLSHIGGLSVLTRCLLARAAVALADTPGESQSGERLFLGLERTGATLASMVPTQLERLLGYLRPEQPLPARLRAILTGGAASSAALLAACAERGWPILTTYGLTEACSQVATQAPGAAERAEPGVGRALPGVCLKLEGGVIYLKGPMLFSGYHPPHAGTFDAEGWFRTQDLGALDAQGNLHVLGRADDLIISGGENVQPGEVERVLESCAGVRQAFVFGVPDPSWGQVVAAAVVLEPGDTRPALERLGRAVLERLAPFKRPRLLACMAAFVFGSTGKLDRRRTREAALALLEAWDTRVEDASARR